MADPVSSGLPLHPAQGAWVPISALESETGLTREVIRKWESRYGFPQPKRDKNGDRIYPVEQVVCLRLIRRLLGAGMRPGKVVGLDLAALEQLSGQLLPPEATATSAEHFSQQVLDALSRHDLIRLDCLFRQRLFRVGLSLFVRETVSISIALVGEAWLRGTIRVFEEHLFTEIVSSILRDAIRTVTEPSGSPRVLLSTPPEEIHTMGLLMANAELSLHGAYCIGLGAQTPATEIVAAVDACHIDVVGLSFSIAHPVRDVARFLRDLSSRLAPSVEVWAGGQGVLRSPRIAGVRYFHDLDEIELALAAWKSRHDGPRSEPELD
ncbi:MAG: MerR family transcriptional regulator [Azospirillaceae bacterium]|nr:MerR family transcriptional regulator [Azospirillaceae bacterium]